MPENNAPIKLADMLKAPAGWSPSGYRGNFTAGNLHEYLNGGAERYLGYGFYELEICEYQGAVTGSKEPRIMVELYRMDSPVNAYGIFSSDRAGGADPGTVGAGAALGEYLLQFYQGVYFVRVADNGLAGDLSPALLEFGKLISGSLPGEGENIPELALRLPVEGRSEPGPVYFHTQNSLNSLVYLGEDNILGMGTEVDAVSAEYRVPGGAVSSSAATVRVILICYPDRERCAAGFDRLLRSKPGLSRAAGAGNNISHAATRGCELLLVFGSTPEGWAARLEAEIWEGK